MTEKRHFVLVNDQVRRNAAQFCMDAPIGWYARFSEATRSLEANAAQWPYLEAFSKQLQWPVNGAMTWLTPEEYKDVLTCAFEHEVQPRLAMGFDGGVVMLGRRTSAFGKKKFAEWMSFLEAAAALKGVTPIYKNNRRDSL